MDMTELEVTTRWARSTASLRLDLPAHQLPQLALWATTHSPEFTVRHAGADTVEIACRATWRAYGAVMTLAYRALDARSTHVDVRWVPEMKTNLYVWGQGRDHIRQFAALLVAGTQHPTPPAF